MVTATTSQVSVGGQNSGKTPFGVSADGRYVVFHSRASNLVPSDVNNDHDVFVHDTVTHVITRVSVADDGSIANSESRGGRMTPDGRYMTFWSTATNLVGGDTNSVQDVFLRGPLLVSSSTASPRRGP